MRSYKRFCLVILGCLAVLLVYNALVWNFFTSKILTDSGPTHTGDLARIGYLPDYVSPRRNFDDLPRRHIELSEWKGEKAEVVTIGDSFSNGGGAGRNSYYQDYLATFSGLNVVNLGRMPGGGTLFDVVAKIIHDGTLDRLAPKYCLIELVERSCYRVSYVEKYDFSQIASFDQARSPSSPNQNTAGFRSDDETGETSRVGFINTGNLKWLIYNLLYEFSDNAFFSDVYKVVLDRPLFSGRHGRELLLYSSEVEKAGKHNNVSVAGLNDNLNRLAALLRGRGIELVFMPAPDKYTLYRSYIVDNAFPQSRFFELLRPLSKDYRFIDAEAILAAEVAGGEKDVYHIDDTHWTWKASEAIFSQEFFH